MESITHPTTFELKDWADQNVEPVHVAMETICLICHEQSLVDDHGICKDCHIVAMEELGYYRG